MKKLGLLPPILFFVFAVSQACLPEESAVDATARNREVLARNVDRMQHTELLRLNRGRLKPNPILYPFHTVYQTILSDQEYMLDRLTSVYGNTLVRLRNASLEYPDLSDTPEGKSLAAGFRKELVSLYDLESELDSRETILEMWSDMEAARLGMEILPVRAALAMNARKWAGTYYGGSIPPEIGDRLLALAANQPQCSDIFCSERFLRALSADYSNLFVSITAGGAGSELTNSNNSGGAQ